MLEALRTQSARHAETLAAWHDALPRPPLAGLEPARTAFVAVDVIEGFHRLGPLASPRVTAIIPAVVGLVTRLGDAGVRDERLMFVQDAHPEDAEEFRAYPPHCLAGSAEAEAVSELRALPRWGRYAHARKNSIASHTSEGFVAWLEGLEDVAAIVAVGDVTDLCLFTLALHLQTRSQARGLGQRIVVPADCVQTWDAPDHPGDLYHVLFLHQLARNGVEVVAALA